MTARKKLIEVAMPLDVISEASVREKSIRHGHPSTLHLWWSRKPLATSRAVLFASLVDDPSEHPEQFPGEHEQEQERLRLFRLMEDLITWENSNKPDILAQAQAEIHKSANGTLPPFLDPFAGGGSIPLEAQRLGLESHASDLNPVAVLLNKALIEIPPRFTGRAPVNPDARKSLLAEDWLAAHGLAADIRYYGRWLRAEAEKKIGHLYPKAKLSDGSEASVIAWLWVRTVTCPNPACGAQMPLTSKWWLSKKKGKEAWIKPEVDPIKGTIDFVVCMGSPDKVVAKDIDRGTSAVDKQGKKTKATFECVTCHDGVVKGEYIDIEANAGRMNCMPIAVVAEGVHNRVYLSVNNEQMREQQRQSLQLLNMPEMQSKIPSEPARGTFASNAQGRIYGFKTFADYFSPRQLVALITFSDLIQEVRECVLNDAIAAGLPDDDVALNAGGSGARAYAESIGVYLSLAVDRLADRNSTICSWDTGYVKVRNTFARQAIPMVWDYAEANPFSDSTGNFVGAVDWVAEAVEATPVQVAGSAMQRDATTAITEVARPLISTDPPYYDNIGYADLSDFFYVWLRRSLSSIYPDLFRTMLVPKAPELVATPYRFQGDKKKAQHFFEEGLERAFVQMRQAQHPDYPLTVYYAFKQAESEHDGEDEGQNKKNGQREAAATKVTASTGWETMLEGLMSAGFTITGTWPIHTEMTNRSVGQGTNALASSIVLVCRPREEDAPVASRRQFLNDLRNELPEALKKLQQGGIAPVDLAQASIGPGMAIYSRYRQVIEADGTPLRVRTALQLINRELDAVLAAQEGEYDVQTRWAVAWFDQYAMDEGLYGSAETLSKAKNTTVQALVDAHIIEARAGKVRLLSREELGNTREWHPQDTRTSVWEVMQYLIDALDRKGEEEAARLLKQAGEKGEIARDLAYRLYTICERKGWTQEAQAYNSLVINWSQVSFSSQSAVVKQELRQQKLM